MHLARGTAERATVVALIIVLHITVSGACFAQKGRDLPPASRVNARLDTLERLALTSPKGDERVSATIGVASPGRYWFVANPQTEGPPEVRYAGIVARLARIYRQADYRVRSLIVVYMVHQAERAQAAAFLGEVAQEPPEPASPAPPGVAVVGDDTRSPLQADAIGALTYMGPEGRAVLERLHVAGTVTEPTARWYLEQLARRGFQRQGN